MKFNFKVQRVVINQEGTRWFARSFPYIYMQEYEDV